MSSFQTHSPDDLPSLLVLQSNSSLFSRAEAKLGMILHLEQSVRLLLNTKPLLPGRNRVTSQQRESCRRAGVWKHPWWMLHKSNDWTWGLCSVDEDEVEAIVWWYVIKWLFHSVLSAEIELEEYIFCYVCSPERNSQIEYIKKIHIHTLLPFNVAIPGALTFFFFFEVNRCPVINLMQLLKRLNMEVVCFHHLFLPTLPVSRCILTCPERFWLCNELIVINSSSSIQSSC